MSENAKVEVKKVPPQESPFEAMPKLFQYVIWPAVAGSVAWSFFTVLVMESSHEERFWPKLVALFAIGVYLAFDWVSTESFFGKINPTYWIADAFLAPATAVFAIATEKAIDSWAKWAIGIAFVGAIIAHLFGAWDLKDEGTPKKTWKDRWKDGWKNRIALAVINFIGVALLLIGGCISHQNSLWVTPISIASVVFFYMIYVLIKGFRRHPKR